MVHVVFYHKFSTDGGHQMECYFCFRTRVELAPAGGESKKTRTHRFFPHELRCFYCISVTDSLITRCTHSEEEDTSSKSVNKVTEWPSVRSEDTLQTNAGFKSTQLMPRRVNTAHTMGVDVIDKTVGGVSDTESLDGWRACLVSSPVMVCRALGAVNGKVDPSGGEGSSNTSTDYC